MTDTKATDNNNAITRIIDIRRLAEMYGATVRFTSKAVAIDLPERIHPIALNELEQELHNGLGEIDAELNKATNCIGITL